MTTTSTYQNAKNPAIINHDLMLISSPQNILTQPSSANRAMRALRALGAGPPLLKLEKEGPPLQRPKSLRAPRALRALRAPRPLRPLIALLACAQHFLISSHGIYKIGMSGM